MSRALEGRTIAALASFDSFAKTAMAILSVCRQQGATTSLNLLEIPGRKLSRRQRVEVQRIDTRTRMLRHSWADSRELCQQLEQDCDALVLSLDGQRSRELLLHLEHQKGESERQPLLISAYPGILFRYQLEGMLDRSGVDLLCLNSEQDLKTYQEGCDALNIDASNAVCTGLPILWNLKPPEQRRDRAPFVFFEQPSIPAHPLQRRFLCQQLQVLAQAWPEHPVIFKPRTSSVESTLHRRHGEMAEMIRKMKKETPNLTISLLPASRLLSDCGCAITVSSTAALEAMAMGVSTRIVADLGVNESLGNHYFAASGAVASFETIIADPFSLKHDPHWLRRAGWIQEGSDRFLAMLCLQLETGASPQRRSDKGSAGWGSETWRTYALAHGGRRMLSSGGALSSRKKRHHGVRLARRVREKLVGLWGVEQWIKG